MPWPFLQGKKTTRALLSGYIILSWEEFFTEQVAGGGGELFPQDHLEPGKTMEARKGRGMVGGSSVTPS